jgi:hypothetical protein
LAVDVGDSNASTGLKTPEEHHGVTDTLFHDLSGHSMDVRGLDRDPEIQPFNPAAVANRPTA